MNKHICMYEYTHIHKHTYACMIAHMHTYTQTHIHTKRYMCTNIGLDGLEESCCKDKIGAFEVSAGVGRERL